MSTDAVARSRKTDHGEWFNSTVELEPENGGGYMATIEMFHQLHCLVNKAGTELHITMHAPSVTDKLTVFAEPAAEIHTYRLLPRQRRGLQVI